MRPTMRAPWIVAALMLAGCAGTASEPTPAGSTPTTSAPLATPPANATPTPDAAPAAATPTTSVAPTPGPRLGVLFDETYNYAGKSDEVRRTFEVDRGVAKLYFYVESAGPPADGSFTSAVMDVYTPRSTGAMFVELPGQQARNYTLEHHAGDPYWGTWTVRFAGTGATSVTLRVTAE